MNVSWLCQVGCVIFLVRSRFVVGFFFQPSLTSNMAETFAKHIAVNAEES